jgi:hypothetical protein
MAILHTCCIGLSSLPFLGSFQKNLLSDIDGNKGGSHDVYQWSISDHEPGKQVAPSAIVYVRINKYAIFDVSRLH